MNPYALNWDDFWRAFTAFDRRDLGNARAAMLRPRGQPWFHAKPGDDPGDETRADGFTEFHFDDGHRDKVLIRRKWLLRDCEWFFVSPLGAESAELCPVCGVAWGMDCGRTNCGLAESENASRTAE